MYSEIPYIPLFISNNDTLINKFGKYMQMCFHSKDNDGYFLASYLRVNCDNLLDKDIKILCENIIKYLNTFKIRKKKSKKLIYRFGELIFHSFSKLEDKIIIFYSTTDYKNIYFLGKGYKERSLTMKIKRS